MRTAVSALLVCAGLSATAARADPAPAAPTLDAVNAAAFDPAAPAKPKGDVPDPLLIKAQVLLDRAHASPGTIDGRSGDNFVHALDGFAAEHRLKPSATLTPEIWAALGDDPAHPPLVSYTVTAGDVARPFTPDIPSDYGQAAKLQRLGYRNAREALAERFHMDEKLLKVLNPDVADIKEGTKLVVAEVTRSPVAGALDHVDVDKAKGQVRGLAADGAVLVAYPATIGSTDLPSPTGTHAVKGVAWNPVYSYDPDKNFLQGHNTHKLKLPAGSQQPGRHRVHRPRQADLRPARHAGSLDDRQDALAWLRPHDELGCRRARAHGA